MVCQNIIKIGCVRYNSFCGISLMYMYLMLCFDMLSLSHSGPIFTCYLCVSPPNDNSSTGARDVVTSDTTAHAHAHVHGADSAISTTMEQSATAHDKPTADDAQKAAQ